MLNSLQIDLDFLKGILDNSSLTYLIFSYIITSDVRPIIIVHSVNITKVGF